MSTQPGVVKTGQTFTLQNISTELATVSDWHALGVKLELPGHVLSEIQQSYPNDSTRCKHEMVTRLLHIGRNCTWQALSNALHEIGNHNVAVRITNNYLTSQRAIVLRNIQTMKGKFASLLTLAGQKLKSLPVDIEDVRLHLIVKCSPSESLEPGAGININTILGAATNIDAIFSALTTHHLWDHLNYNLLQSIVKEFASRDEELNSHVEQYQRDVTEFLVSTKIKDYLVAVRSDTLPAENVLETPNPGVFTELSLKVDANITELTFQYIVNLGKSLAAQFHLPTPALLFHKITEGSFTVIWRVLSYLVPHLRAKVPENASFFDEKQIRKVKVFSDHEECLYAKKRKQQAKFIKTRTVKRRSRCGKCKGCCRVQDCGDCINCKDKPRFGGPGKRKQVCEYRRCTNLKLSPPKRCRKKQKTSDIKQCADLDDHHRLQDIPSTKDFHPPPFYMQPTGLHLFLRHRLGRAHLCKSAQSPFSKIDVQGIEEPSAEELKQFLLTKKQKSRTQSQHSQLSGNTIFNLSQRGGEKSQIENTENYPTEDEEDIYPALKVYMKPSWTDLFLRHKLGSTLLHKSARSPFRDIGVYAQEVLKPSDQALEQFKTTKEQKCHTLPCKQKKLSTLPFKRKKPLSLALKRKKAKVSSSITDDISSKKTETHAQNVNLRKRRREKDAADDSSSSERDGSEEDGETLTKQSVAEPRAKKKRSLHQQIDMIEKSNLKLIVCIPQNLIEQLPYSHQSEDPVHSSSAVVLHNDLTISDQYLGCGSFGEVYKGTYKGNPCAVKIAGRSHLKQREWEILKEMKHPNVVSCLDVDTNPKEYPGKLALVMELMERNLTEYLEAETKILLYTKLTLCSDIIDALMYLHAKGIVHRDLTSNNVLLKAGTAKLGDFGMAKHLDDPGSLTEIPGTEAYMPPEAYPPNQHYTEALDIFSFGVLAIQIITQERPKPSDRVKVVPHPKYPRGTLMVVSEIERRRSHINKIDASHPLRDTALICIADQCENRPTANEIGSHIRHLKHESMKQREEMLEKELKEKDQKISALEIANERQAQLIQQQKQDLEQCAQTSTQLQDKINGKDEVISKWEGQAKKQVAELQKQVAEWQELFSISSKEI